ncbi:ribonuclease H-like domain-containing protein, partial [Tanacetum coccineum]
MFRQTLRGATRNWFDDLDPKSVDNFKELSQKSLEEFSQQNRYAKDPTKIHGIKRRQNEGLQAFMDWFKSKSPHIKGVPPVLCIAAFMHGHGHSELAKKLNDKIPKTMDKMFERVRAFIRGEVAAGEVLSFDKTKPQPQPLPICPPLDISLGDKRGLEPPIKPHSLGSFRMKEVDHLTNNTPPSPHVASFHPKDTYCHYHPCIGDPKKHYGFKPGLLGLSEYLGVDFLKLGMIEDDWELESKEVSFLGRELNSPIRPKEVENVRIKETHRLEHKIQQILFQHVAPSRHH